MRQAPGSAHIHCSHASMQCTSLAHELCVTREKDRGMLHRDAVVAWSARRRWVAAARAAAWGGASLALLCTSRHSLYLRKHITATQAPARRLQATGCLLFRSALLPARLGTAVVHDLHHVVSCRARPQEEVCAAEEAAGERRGWRPSGRPRPSVQRSYLQQAVVPTFRPTWVTLQEAASGGGANAAGAPL